MPYLPNCCTYNLPLMCSVERFELVRLHWRLVLVQVSERVLSTVVVGIVVGINGLGLKARNSIELLDGCRTEAGQGTEYRALDLRNLSVLHGIDQGVLGLCGVVLQLLGSVLLTERSNFVEVHLQVVCHLLGKVILRSLQLKERRGLLCGWCWSAAVCCQLIRLGTCHELAEQSLSGCTLALLFLIWSCTLASLLHLRLEHLRTHHAFLGFRC